jgi:hypothetical protein
MRRITVTALTALSAVGIISGPLTPAAARPAPPAAPSSNAARPAAGWLARHLVGPHHDHYVEAFKGKRYPDYGDTADAVLSLDATGVAAEDAARASRWLADHIAGYTEDTCGTTTTYYPGSLSKALVVAEAQGRNVRSFGGQDLVAELQHEETAHGSDAGLFADPDTTCGFQSPITQAYALIGLSGTGRAADGPDGRAIGWLTQQQCADGGYEGSDRDPSTACKHSDEDVDTTGFVVQALAAVRGRHGAATTEHRAVKWLVAEQKTSGGFGQPPTGPNANSTAVAVQALLAVSDDRAARAGQTWLARRQEGCSAAANRRGSIDYQSSYVAGSTQLTATAQGTQALAGGVLGRISAAGGSDRVPRPRC